MSKIFEWFHHNSFRAKPGNFYFLLSSLIDRPIKIIESIRKTSKVEVLMIVEWKRKIVSLSFKEYLL